VPDHLDFGRDDIQLLRDDFADLGQGVAIVRTGALVICKFVDDLYTGQRFRQFFAAPFAAAVLGDNDGLVFSGCCRLCLDFGFIEQADLIR